MLNDKLTKLILLAVITIANCLIFSTPAMSQNLSNAPLPSWNEGINKQTILKFVESVTDPNNPNYVSPQLRIATIDNDGTLWAEKPMYFQAAFTLSRIQELAPNHPEWKEKYPFKAVIENDQQYLSNLSIPELLEMVMVTHAGMTQTEFESQARQFLTTAKHPRFQKLYPEVIYQPMLELIAYLQANDFTIFICSAGGLDFMRQISQEAYNIAPENVIGSSILKKFQLTSTGSQLIRQAKVVEPINDREGKPVNIERFIGKKPLIAVGNSDGDIEMLQYTVVTHNPSLALLLHHDDAEREYSYTQETEKALELAPQYNWQVISMKKDFKQVYSFE